MNEKNIFKDKSIVGSPAKHFVSLAVLLFIFWILLSGKFEFKFLIYGAVTAVVTAWLCMPLLYVENEKKDKKYFVLGVSIFSLIKYWAWLMKEVVLSNISIVKSISRQEPEIDPVLTTFKMPMDNPMALSMLANSITLTPLTITINLENHGKYEVHALTKEASQGLGEMEMQKRIAELYNEDIDIQTVHVVEEANYTYMADN